MYDTVGEENNGNNGFLSEQDGVAVRNNCKISPSLDKRIIPRCLVVRVLLLKGFIEEEKLRLTTVIYCSDNYCLDKFVARYLDQVAQLSNVYQGKVDVQDV